MKNKVKKLIILLAICIFIFPTLNYNVSSYSKTLYGDISGLSYKQEINVPIDTSLEISKYQPIDIRIKKTIGIDIDKTMFTFFKTGRR